MVLHTECSSLFSFSSLSSLWFKVNEFLGIEGPTLLDMRIKHLIKQNEVEKAARLAKVCTEYPEFGGKRNFKQAYLVCLCGTSSQEQLKEEVIDF